jgi:hypothetical protein
VQSGVALPFLPRLVSGMLWPGLSDLVLDEGELWLHQQVCGVGKAHLPTLVLLMEGVQWILCAAGLKGLLYPSEFNLDLCHTYPPTGLHVSVRCPARHLL